MRRARGRGAVARAAGVVALAFVCGFGSGCAEKQTNVDFSDLARDYASKDYERVYDRWTRHQQVFKDEDVALEVWATYKSWDFREAYIERYAEVYGLADADENTLREAQRQIVSAAYEFHVTAQSTFYKWNDLDKPNSPWRATLIDALGHELTPEYVRIVKLPDAYERSFFPAKTPFTKTYAIRFAVPNDGSFTGAKSGSLTLRLASPVGRIELRWNATS
jgi:hypothetical protein